MSDPASGTDLLASRRAWRWWWPLLLAPALIGYSFDAPFSRHDDPGFIEHNRLLQPSSGWAEAWQTHSDQHFYYPLTLTSWRIDRSLAGTEAWPSAIRLGNLLLHLAAALSVWWVLRQLGASPSAACFVMAAFVLHPMGVESVAWATERKNVLSGAFGLAALGCYIHAARVQTRAWVWWTGSIALYAAALLSKPSALGLFAVAAVWEALKRPGLVVDPQQKMSAHAPGSSLMRDGYGPAALRLAPWVILSAVGTWLGVTAHGQNLLPPPGGNAFTALLTDVPILQRYFLNLACPLWLSAYYPVAAVMSLADGRLWLGAVVLLTVIGGTWTLARGDDRPRVTFAWLWFVGALGPNLNLVGLNDLMHDRFLYLSMPAFWWALTLAVQGAMTRAAGTEVKVPRTVPVTVTIMLALFWAWSSLQRSALFADTELLFTQAVHVEPNSAPARIFLARDLRASADAARRAGDATLAETLSAQSIEHFAAGIEGLDFNRYLMPQRALTDLGMLYYERGRLKEAEAVLARAVGSPAHRHRDRSAEGLACEVLGLMALQNNDPVRALNAFDAALHANPGASSTHLHRARALLVMQRAAESDGRIDDARQLNAFAREALQQVLPNAPAYGEAQSWLHALPPVK